MRSLHDVSGEVNNRISLPEMKVSWIRRYKLVTTIEDQSFIYFPAGDIFVERAKSHFETVSRNKVTTGDSSPYWSLLAGLGDDQRGAGSLPGRFSDFAK